MKISITTLNSGVRVALEVETEKEFSPEDARVLRALCIRAINLIHHPEPEPKSETVMGL
jgi:hypothetical protein